MDIEKRISPFAADVSFADVTTLLKAFRQKALSEGWEDEEIDYVIAEASKGELQTALSVILSYTEIIESDDIDDEDIEFDVIDEEDPFQGDEDFVIEDEIDRS